MLYAFVCLVSFCQGPIDYTLQFTSEKMKEKENHTTPSTTGYVYFDRFIKVAFQSSLDVEAFEI